MQANGGPPANTNGEMIAEVERALVRLFDPSTPASEKQQLDQQLAQFREATATCLPIMFQLLQTSRNEYALWFAATTLEEYVTKKWHQFPHTERQQFRQFVWDYLLAVARGAMQQTAFVLRKLRKVIADIAYVEWVTMSEGNNRADAWPDFLSQVEALVVEPSTCESGLELLCVVVEEFGRNDALVLASIKRRVKAQLIAQLPRLLSLLSNILQNCNHHLHQPTDNVNLLAEQDRFAQIALATLNHLISWAPVAELLNDSWINLLFELSLNWEHVTSHICVSSVGALQCLTELMSKRFRPADIDDIVGNILYSLCPLIQKTVEDQVIDRASEEYLDKLSEFVELFLTQHLKRLENPRFESVLPTFLQLVLALTTKQPHVQGFLNCLSVWEVFVSYIEEVEQNEGAANERVRVVLTAYENGLVGVMFHLLDRVNYSSNKDQLEELSDDDDAEDGKVNGVDDGSSENHVPFDMEKDILHSYGTGSLQDLAQLSADRTSGNNTATEATELSDRKQFIVDCIALIRRIASFPSCAAPLLERMVPRVQETCQNLIFRIHEAPTFSPRSDPWEQERYAVRDATTNCAILSSVCAQYYSTSQDMNHQMAGWQILHLFITLSEYLVQHRLHTRGSVFVELQCEALTCVRFCLSCIPFVIKNGAREEVLKATESVLQILLHTLDTTIVPSPQVVMQNSMQLLANLGFVLSYDDMIQIPSMSQLETHIHQFSLHLPLSIQGDLYSSMSNSILNSAISLRNGSSMNVSEASVQRWGDAYGSLILPIRESIDESARTLQQNEHRVLERAMITQIQRDCYLVRCLARSVETKPKIAKDAFFSVYQAAFPPLMSLLTTYVASIQKIAGNNPHFSSQVYNALKVVNEIVRLYAQLLKSIRKEMQKSTVAEIMRVFVEIFSNAQLTATLNIQGSPGVAVLCGFLQLLKIVVEEPTSVFSSFLQNILELCFGPLKETIFSHPESDSVILSFFIELMEQLLEKHYRFFVSYSGFNAEGVRERSYASDVAHTYFLSIFQSLASILSRQGTNLAPRICGQVLALLDRVDKSQGLFSFSGFKNELRMGFLSTLMNILTRGELNLLQDELIQLLHQVASVDFASFYQVFLPEYVKEILSPQQLEAAGRQEDESLQWSGQVDLPTFSQEVVAFLNDLRVLKAQS